MEQISYTYQQFEEEIINRMKARYGAASRVEASDVQKNNGVLKRVLIISKPEESISPLIYLEPYFACYQRGNKLETIVEMIDQVYRNDSRLPEVKWQQLCDFQMVKGQIVFQLINWEKNADTIKDMPHKRLYGDLVVIFIVLLKQREGGQIGAKITNSHMKLWGTDVEMLWKLAEQNTPRLQPVRLAGLKAVIRELEEKEIGEEASGEEMIYLLSNRSGMYGAAAILYPGVLKQAAEQIGGNLLILPSSVHETLLMIWDETMDLDIVSEMVRCINRERVTPEERLSDAIYIYWKMEDRVERVPDRA